MPIRKGLDSLEGALCCLQLPYRKRVNVVQQNVQQWDLDFLEGDFCCLHLPNGKWVYVVQQDVNQ